MEGADDTCGVTAAGIVVNYASLFVTCIASYRIALFVAPQTRRSSSRGASPAASAP